jgi:hypothetical protein
MSLTMIIIIVVSSLGFVLYYKTTADTAGQISQRSIALTQEFSRAIALPLLNFDMDTVSQKAVKAAQKTMILTIVITFVCVIFVIIISTFFIMRYLLDKPMMARKPRLKKEQKI